MHTISTMTPATMRPGYVAPHRTHYTTAMAFIEAHGHFAAITRDGLLAMSRVFGMKDTGIQGANYDDVVCEEPMVFEVDEDGMVSSREVRVWLGY